MSQYVDGFVLPIPTKQLAAYKKMARLACKVWREHGALDYRECVGDDLEIKGMYSFLKMTKAKPDQTVVLAWITYKSKAHRNKVNAGAMNDPRLRKMMQMTEMPFDPKRMAYGGFKTIVK